MRTRTTLIAAALLAAGALLGRPISTAVADDKQPKPEPAFTPAELAQRTLHRRAVEAVIWGMPLVNTDAMRQAYFRDAGAKYNDICYFSKPADWHFQVTTPNASTNYVYFNFNLKEGPVVVEIPAAVGAGLLGSMVNAWDEPMADIGPKGEDQGKGGKYLLLPPDFKGEAPDGFFTLRFSTYNGYSLFRAIRAGSTDSDVAASLALVKKLRVYPLAAQANPPAQRFIDIHGKTFDGIANFDERFFESLNRMVQEEPVQPRDLVMMGMLMSIGIEKGKEFKTDTATQGVLKAGVQEAQAQFVEGLTSYSQPWWPDRNWSPADSRGVKTGFTFQTADALDVDARGWANFAAFALPKKTGESLMYLFTFRDSRGQRLSGERHYTLRVPANVPAKQYWSVIVYDVLTAAFIRESPVITLDSYNQAMKRNADGTVDIYFGPTAPAGKEANWIYTAPGRAFFPAVRFYDPDKPLFDRTWKLPNVEEVK
jgi:hypothetical protein